MSKNLSIQIVSESFSFPLYHQFLLKPSFSFYLSASIQRILDPYSHSSDRILTHDTLLFSKEKQRLRKYIGYNDGAYRLFIQMIGQHYQKSPNQPKTELPLMILTDTKSIFLRRTKRLKKLQKQQYSEDSSSSTSSFISFSKSYMPKGSCNYLESRISQKDISELSEFKSSLLQSESNHLIFQPQFSSNQSQLLLLRKKSSQKLKQWFVQSGIKMQSNKSEERDQVMIKAIKSPEEERLGHLIYGEISTTSENSDHNEVIDLLEEKVEVPRLDYYPSQDWKSLPLNLKKRVEIELDKYKVANIMKLNEVPPYRVVSSHRKQVRQKAQQLLLSIQNLR